MDKIRENVRRAGDLALIAVGVVPISAGMDGWFRVGRWSKPGRY